MKKPHDSDIRQAGCGDKYRMSRFGQRGGGSVRLWPSEVNEDGSVIIFAWQMERMLHNLKVFMEVGK